jgi:hypothetical protein
MFGTECKYLHHFEVLATAGRAPPTILVIHLHALL